MVLAFLSFVFAYVFLLPIEERMSILSEDALIEMASAFGYLACATLMLLVNTPLKQRYPVVLILLAMAA